MTRFRLTAVVLAAGAVLWSASARANTITINGGQNSTFPPTFTMLVSGSSPLAVSGRMCCPNYTVTVSAVGTPPEGSGDLFSNTIPHSNGTTMRTLFIWVTETGITAPLGTDRFHSSFTANEFVGHVSSVTLSTYLNPSGSVSPIGSANGQDLLGTATFTSSGVKSTTLTMPTGPGPYALAELYAITTSGSGASTNLTINLTTSVIPEPTSLALLGTGVVGLAGLLRRKLNL